MTIQQPVRHVPGRGYNISGTGLFRDGDGLSMYPTKRVATAFARQWGWSAKDVCRVFSPLFGGYAVAQPLALGDHYELVFLCDDGSTKTVPVEYMNRLRSN